MKNEEFASARITGTLHNIMLRILLCATFFILHSSFFIFSVHAQYNIDRLITIGRSALYYEDYVLSMQYFNQAIAAKPYLYEPWFLRGVAKYSLDDFAGAEADCTAAIERNPYVVSIYELRGLTRIQQEKFPEAIADYNRALTITPDNRSLWHNRVLCHLQNKDYDVALAELDTMHSRWSTYAQAYTIRADVYMQMSDTAQAVQAFEKSLEIDPYDGKTWAARSIISLSRKEWPEAENQLDHAIHLLPKTGNYYINRALARYNQNNLRGAMADYDAALDLEPNNFLGHYNRGLLRADVGDDNRAITDFDFVLDLEPDNMLALFNRAVLLDRTGDLQGAVRDYTSIIDEYPNFYTAILYRARCYRRLGQTAKAELDEFKIYRTQLYQQLYGLQPKATKRNQRKRSDLDLEKYNELVVADEQEPEREYKSDYRGRVQNRHADMDLLPMFTLALEPQRDDVNKTRHSDIRIDELNEQTTERPLYVSNAQASLDTSNATAYFNYIDSLSAVVGTVDRVNPNSLCDLLLRRAVAYAAVQDYDSAISDLSFIIEDTSPASHLSPSVSHLPFAAVWLKTICQSRLSQYQNAVDGTKENISKTSAIKALDDALLAAPSCAYLLYNRGCLKAQLLDYTGAIDDFTEAISADAHLAEAYYNRGICRLKAGLKADGIADLSKAGEQGLYAAYSIIKQYRNTGAK
jgi:tetratricopeptide (TPR) repeat protein